MKVVEMNAGRKIEYAANGTVLTFGAGALSIDLARLQRDYEVTKDIMADADGALIIGTGRAYVAEVVIPAMTFTETTTGEGEEATTERTADPLDMDKVELRLFSIDGVYIG